MMKDEWRMIKDEGWMMQYDDFKLLRGFDLWQTDERTDICDCRVAFATENVAIALIWALHHMCFYYWVTCDTITQKNLCEKYVTEVQTYNQQRGAKKNLTSIRQIIDFQMVMLL